MNVHVMTYQEGALALLHGISTMVRGSECGMPCRCHRTSLEDSDGLFTVFIGAPLHALARRPQ